MTSELILNFSDANRVTVSLDGSAVKAVEFEPPIVKEEFQDLRWYLETYASEYTADVDDERAGRIVVQLKDMGQRLFDSVFMDRASSRLFDHFLNARQPGRVLTINASQPEILALPWELLRVPGRGAYMFTEKPQISVRRNLSQSLEGYLPTQFEPKPKLRVLVVVSRPKDAGWLDPRADGLALMNAVDRHGQCRIEVEFLRPGTFEALVNRLNNTDLPPIDILHFDGHGAFDKTGFFNKGGESELLKKGEGRNMGYLLFEKADGTQNPVSADRLGQFLNQQGLGLVLLSACQSSLVLSDQEAEQDSNGIIGSVAARLTQTGVPAVVAMSYSVLAKTTERLFGEFYASLVRGEGIGASLDQARRHLLMNPDRGNRQRGQEQVTLRVEDWFVPTLYQLGWDPGMVLVGSADDDGKSAQTLLIGQNMPKESEVGFFGRRRELWAIEKAFTANPDNPKQETRRVTISGFGGQGKTALAAEAGRWLLRTGMFDAVTFVDYQACQNIDAISVAVSTIARDLDVNLIDADAVTAELKRRRVLVILDNLEDVSEQAQKELLTAAIAWSEAGQSRVLITTRQDDLGHSGYEHQLIELKGLGSVAYPEDAIDYFQALMQVPPQPAKIPVRKALIALFTKVDFHPLSIGLVAEQLRTQNIVKVDQALDRLLAGVPAGQSKDRSLIASLNLSIDRLDGDSLELVKRLGVFQGGAMEDNLLVITEFTAEQWSTLRQQLEAAGLVTTAILPNISVPYFKFHPTLAPVLWGSLGTSDQKDLKQRHQERYYELSKWLYVEDQKNPHEARDIARRELPNLMSAVRSALTSEDENSIEFVSNVNQFLFFFGMTHDRKQLTDQAEMISGAVGSRSWYISRNNLGEQLWNAGRIQESVEIFEEVLHELGTATSYDRAVTLGKIARSYVSGGQSNLAVDFYRQSLEELGKLDPSDDVKRATGVTHVGLGTVLRHLGLYSEARLSYEASLAIDQELGDDRGAAVANFQLGTLTLMEGNPPLAQQFYQIAFDQFQALGESTSAAIILHQQGNAYVESQLWDAAQDAYRRSAEIKEQQSNLSGAAKSWNQLATVLKNIGKFREAEAYYRKAIDAGKELGDEISLSKRCQNLADLIQSQGSDRLSEARHLAEKSLDIQKKLAPAACEIWLTYITLANISIQQGEQSIARDYRRQSRYSYATFEGSKHELQHYESLVQSVISTVQDSNQIPTLEEELKCYSTESWADLIIALRQILAGERDEDILCEYLDYKPALIVGEVLKRIEKLEVGR